MPTTTTIVTAIPYVNSTPHLGTVLDQIAGDITARYHRMRGEKVLFVVGTDENGLKIKEAAEALGRDPHEFVADIANRFKVIFDGLEISYDDFIRTTEKRHLEASQELFRILQERCYVYTGTYEGWYDVSSETFFKESDLIDGKSPDGNEVRWVSEENYFFKLSAFEQPLLEHIEANPHWIVPESRRNEVVGFIKEGLRDMAISRRNPGWGIPVPGNDRQVIYVWFDALINYIAAAGWPNPGWEEKWPPIVQWLGKDILPRFHATLWPAMLMGIGLPLPKVLAVHAWITVGSGEKLSKSKGNMVEPLVLAEDLAKRSGCADKVAVDAVRHYLTAIMPYENDSNFTYEEFDRRYNADLANDLGNALNRTLAMAHKFVGGQVPSDEAEDAAIEAISAARDSFEAAVDAFRMERASESAFGLVRFLNKYIDTRAPWALAKAGDPSLPAVLKSMLLCIRSAEALVRPIMPTASDVIAEQLGLPPLTDWSLIGSPESLPNGTALSQPKPIFPRLEKQVAPAPPPPDPKPQPKPMETPAPVAEIDISEFAKVQLRVGRVLEAEPLEGADKLLKLQVVIAGQQRQIVAGIRKAYSPEDLIGRQVVVVANLKPAKLRGVESQGMLLAAVDDDGNAILLQPDREAPEGSIVR
ncbi:MAG TPA: methionine--tRNA ligase [Fimbriimonas sp.]|nr:methionine--tRNA ligase [Fimbriimonas sp.]